MAESKITLTGGRELEVKFEALNHALRFNKRLMGLIGHFMQLRILKHTAMGKDAEGTVFESYSKGYAKKRKAAGLPIGKVDLFWTGSMLSSMTYAEQDNIVRLFFQNTTDKFGSRNPQKAYFLQTHSTKPRNFFSINAKDIVAIEKMIRKYIKHITQKKVSRGRK